MCNPMTAVALGSLVMSAAQTYAQYEQASRAADARTAALKQGVELSNTQTSQQYEQNDQASAQQQSERHRQFLIDQGHLEAVLGESGLQGATQERILGENENNAASDMATIEANRVRANNQAASGAQAQRLQADTQQASIKRPSALSAGLQIAGNALASERTYHPIEDTYKAGQRALGITQAPAPVETAAPRSIK